MGKKTQLKKFIKTMVSPRKPQGGKTIAAWGFFWNFSGQIGNTLARLLVIGVLARLLEPENFGVLAICMVIVSFSSIVTELGFGPALVQKKELETTDFWTSLMGTLILSLSMAILLFIFSPQLSNLFGKEDISEYLRTLSLVFFFHGIIIVAKSLMLRAYEFQKIIITEFISYVLGFGILGILLAYKGFGTWSLVWGAVAQSFSQAIFYLAQLRIPGRFSVSLKSFKSLANYGFGQSLAQIANFFTQQGDILIIGRTLSPSQIGLYRQASQLSLMPQTIVGNAIDSVAFPTMSRAQDEKILLQKQYLGYSRILILIVSTMAVFGIIFAEEIILIIFGIKWTSMIIPFRILAVTLFYRPLGRICHCLIRATGQVYRRALIEGISGGLLLISTFLGSLLWGINGACFGKVIIVLLNTVALIFLSTRILDISVGQYLKNLALAFLLITAQVLFLFVLRYMFLSMVSLPLLRLLVGGITFLAVSGLLILRYYEKILGFNPFSEKLANKTNFSDS